MTILGQAEESPSWGEVAAGTIESAVGGIGTALSRAWQGVTGGGDVEGEAEAGLPQIPETPGDVTGVVGTGKASARKPSTEGGDAGAYYSPGTGGGASLWPWILGVGLIAGVGYWFVKRRKKRGKGRK